MTTLQMGLMIETLEMLCHHFPMGSSEPSREQWEVQMQMQHIEMLGKLLGEKGENYLHPSLVGGGCNKEMNSMYLLFHGQFETSQYHHQ